MNSFSSKVRKLTSLNTTILGLTLILLGLLNIISMINSGYSFDTQLNFGSIYGDFIVIGMGSLSLVGGGGMWFGKTWAFFPCVFISTVVSLIAIAIIVVGISNFYKVDGELVLYVSVGLFTLSQSMPILFLQILYRRTNS